MGPKLITVEQEKEVVSELLEPVATVNVEGADYFVASDHFKIGETDGVKIGFLENNFMVRYLEKVEKNIPKADLRIRCLKEHSQNSRIAMGLGGKNMVETSLAYMWNMLKKQGHGQDGLLLIGIAENIFYIPDKNGVLGEVVAGWDIVNQFWSIGAYPFEDSRALCAGNQTISP